MKLVLIIFAALSIGFMRAEEPLPYDVQRASDQRVAAVDKINKTYIQELEKLKIKYTKQGNLEVANQIVNLISVVQTEEYVGKWAAGGLAIEIKQNGDAVAGAFRGKWNVKGEVLTIQWNHGFIDSYDLPAVNGVLKGKNQIGKPLSITKVK